jgi:hypothetical protein
MFCVKRFARFEYAIGEVQPLAHGCTNHDHVGLPALQELWVNLTDEGIPL